MGRGEFIDKNAHWPISAEYICFYVYARHAGFVREVPKDSESDFNWHRLHVGLIETRYRENEFSR